MDNPIIRFDLGSVNFTQHPKNADYVVFQLVDSIRAASFESELEKQKKWFEKGQEVKKQVTKLLIGLHKTVYNKAQKINFAVEAKHKKFRIRENFLNGLSFYLVSPCLL